MIRRASIALLLLVSLAACGSQKGAGYLYEEGSDGQRLLNSEIRMETQRFRRGGPGPDIRSITCKDGVFTAFYQSPAMKEEGEVAISFEDYKKIWATVLDSAGWTAEPEAMDPQGGLYHFIRFRMGTRVGETSAQDRSNFLGIGSKNILARLELANAITALCSKYIEPVPMQPQVEETEER